MRILALKVTDFKRLKSVELTPDPTLVLLVGRNEQGKTSVLDAIEAGLAGKDASPDRPVRVGTGRADLTLDLGDVVVRRKWTADGQTRLYLENPDGSRPKAPQALLDSLFRRVAFDPVGFSRMDGKDQAQVLRDLAGLTARFAEIDAESKRLADERALVNRDVRKDEGWLAAAPETPGAADAPDAEVSLADLTDELTAALEEQSQNDAIRAGLLRERAEHQAACAMLGGALARVEELKRQLERAEADVRTWEDERDRAWASVEESEGIACGLADPDVAAIRARLADAERTNEAVRAKQRRAEVQSRWVTNREHAADLTGQIESLAAEKAALLAEARYPVEGLDVRGDEVLLDGVPLSQASGARRVRVGLAVGAALHPSLRVALVRDGSLLDDDAMAEVESWARANDFQVWVERVGGTSSPVGVVIEDGQVLADRGRAAAASEAAERSRSVREDLRLTTRAPSASAAATHAETVADAERLF